ncbi:hypothetical protein [Pseudalkalibacillus caeni]|nr:hypothetical protein [Pseudalkalibacillus caeni]
MDHKKAKEEKRKTSKKNAAYDTEFASYAEYEAEKLKSNKKR